MGKGLEYNLNLIDDPGATLAKVTSRTRLTYPQTRRYLAVSQLIRNWFQLAFTAGKEGHGKREER